MHAGFPKGVLAGVAKSPTLSKLGNFVQWDLSRFVTAIESLKPDPLVKIEGMREFVKEWKEARNPSVHATYDTEEKFLSNREFSSYIKTATNCLPHIRNPPEEQVNDIYAKLNELERCLSLDTAKSESDVTLINNDSVDTYSLKWFSYDEL